MCMMCIEFQKGRMNIREVAKALMETTDEKHGQEIIDKILSKDKETAEQFEQAMRDALTDYMKKTSALQYEYVYYCDIEYDESKCESTFRELCERKNSIDMLLRLHQKAVWRTKR